MILRDRITITDTAGNPVLSAVPAYVGQARPEDAGAPDNPYGDVANFRAIVRPLPIELDDATHRVVWRGATYSLPVPPALRMRHGRPHHLTIALARSA